MAEFNLEESGLQVDLEATNDSDLVLEQNKTEIFMSAKEGQSESEGINVEELNDPNKISITIADKNAPIIVLFGPPSCGKTMLLIRLARYLKHECKDKDKIKISPIKTFRPSYDENYRKLCQSFDTMMDSDEVAKSTSGVSFMLVEVVKEGKRLCQILEAPGEYYFNPKKPNEKFPRYVNAIINSNNRKIWCIVVEPDWKNEKDRNNYVTRISTLKNRMRTKDKTIFVFNKIDTTNFTRDGGGHVNIVQAKKEVENLYRGIFTPFRNVNPITKFFSEWNCDFIPFQSIEHDEQQGSGFENGPEEYPAKLWSTILKRING